MEDFAEMSTSQRRELTMTFAIMYCVKVKSAVNSGSIDILLMVITLYVKVQSSTVGRVNCGSN